MRKLVSSLLAAIYILGTASVPLFAKAESSPLPTPASSFSDCKTEDAKTTPAPVDMAQVLRDAYALEDDQHEILFRGPNPALDQALTALFDLSTPKSKLEQFYTMLFHISRYTSHPGDGIALDVPKVVNLLLSTRVFSDPDFPRQIAQVQLDRKDRARPHYLVVFDKSEVRLPLNQGLGFGVFREGMCQHAKELVFYGSFSFSLAMKNESLEVYDFDNLDLWGTFGSRGVVDVDVNYVSVKSVDFLKGNTMGLVKAKVSRKEFDVNQHSFLLDLVTRFVTDKSVQPIDW
jgi:hypothetical protein